MESSQTLERAELYPLEKGSKWDEPHDCSSSLPGESSKPAERDKTEQSPGGSPSWEDRVYRSGRLRLLEFSAEKKYQRGESKRARERENLDCRRIPSNLWMSNDVPVWGTCPWRGKNHRWGIGIIILGAYTRLGIAHATTSHSAKNYYHPGHWAELWKSYGLIWVLHLDLACEIMFLKIRTKTTVIY